MYLLKLYLNLGTVSEIRDKYDCADAWTRHKLNEIKYFIKEYKGSVIVCYNPCIKIEAG